MVLDRNHQAILKKNYPAIHAGNYLHTFFFPILHTLDHEVGTALGLGQNGNH